MFAFKLIYQINDGCHQLFATGKWGWSSGGIDYFAGAINYPT
jgi:hypothetical protein